MYTYICSCVYNFDENYYYVFKIFNVSIFQMFDVEEMINFNSFKWKCNMQIFNQTVLNMKVPHIA